MSTPIIELEDVTMRFHMKTDRIMTLKEFVTRKLRRKIQYADFTALSHVSFEVYPGETLGLIGHNGAGKSTVLKVISGILKPTEGRVQVSYLSVRYSKKDSNDPEYVMMKETVTNGNADGVALQSRGAVPYSLIEHAVNVANKRS